VIERAHLCLLGLLMLGNECLVEKYASLSGAGCCFVASEC
jgi:hypothetical protein